MENKNEIIDFVKNNSYFDFEGEEDKKLNFSTRKNGSVSSETASAKDISEGKLLKNKIEKKFQGLDIRIDVVDEWVLLFVYEKVIVEDEYKYIFKKDYQGAGFSNSHNSLDGFIKYANGWIDDVNWGDIKEKLNKITEYKDNQFTGWHWASPIILKRAGENGNKWGYNFYLIKARRKNSSYKDGGAITNGTFNPLGSAKEIGITPKIAVHDMIAKCDCGEKFSYQNSKKDILWQCLECNGMKRIDATKMADGGKIIFKIKSKKAVNEYGWKPEYYVVGENVIGNNGRTDNYVIIPHDRVEEWEKTRLNKKLGFNKYEQIVSKSEFDKA